MKRKIKVSNGPDIIYLKTAFEEFLDAKAANNVADSTLKNYSYSFSNFWNYHELDDEFLVSDVDEGMMNKWKNHMLKEDISGNSVNHYLRDMKAFFKWCFKQEYCAEFDIDLVRVQEQKIKYYSEQEMELLLEKPVGSNDFGVWRTWAIVCFIYATGARAQSVCDVKMEDVDFIRKEITFTHQKNKTLLKLPLSDKLENVLKEYIRKTGIQKEEYVFPNIGGEQLTVNGLRLALNRYCQSRGVKERGAHAIRHAFASQYIRNGGSAVKLQKILNHSDFAMTNRYIHLFGEDLVQDYDDFSPLDTALKKKSRSKKVGI